MGPAEALRRVAYLLEREGAATPRVRAFRNAAGIVEALPEAELARRAAAHTLEDLPGIGPATAGVIAEALLGSVPAYLARLEAMPAPDAGGGAAIRAALVGDCHMHSDWSDGGSTIEQMAQAAVALGHDWAALTDHSPRLTVANGLSPERLRLQIEEVHALASRLEPFRLLCGIEVDILDDGTLDQEPDLLDGLDVVVASVHSKLRMDAGAMTRRLVAAVSSPFVDILGHCTGRLLSGRGRPQSSFDAETVFAAAAAHATAIEINCRPERQDPPRDLIRRALALGCVFSIDTDAHAPGQLEWQAYGCARAAECGVEPARVVTTWELHRLLGWTASHRRRRDERATDGEPGSGGGHGAGAARR